MTLRAVVFDFDGVIANSEPLHFRALRQVLQQAGVDLTETEYYDRYLGFDDERALATIASDRRLLWSDVQVAGMIRRKAEVLEELERNTSVLFPGAADSIRRLASIGPLAVASGALRAEILRVLDREGLTAHFTAIVAAGETPVGKPGPDPYLKAVALLSAAVCTDIHPGECVAVEDSRWGLESARTAGLRTVAVTHTYPGEALGPADAVIHSLDALSWEFLSRLVPRD